MKRGVDIFIWFSFSFTYTSLALIFSLKTMRESIVNSLTFAESSISKFISEQPFIFLVIGIILLRSIIAQMIKSRLKKKYILPYENRDNVENGQFHLDYFKKLHSVNLFGVALILSLIFIYFVTKGEVISTVLAVAIWAMVITFQTFLVSFLMYFILMNKYKVWEAISIPDLHIQGEILSIKPFSIGLSGKTDDGENDGKAYSVSNYQLWLHPVTRLRFGKSIYTKIVMKFPYEAKNFATNFDETVEKLQTFLDEFLPLRPAAQVKYYNTYVGVKYKMDFDYEDGKSVIKVSYITSMRHASSTKKRICSMIESLKKHTPEE